MKSTQPGLPSSTRSSCCVMCLYVPTSGWLCDRVCVRDQRMGMGSLAGTGGTSSCPSTFLGAFLSPIIRFQALTIDWGAMIMKTVLMMTKAVPMMALKSVERLDVAHPLDCDEGPNNKKGQKHSS